MLTGGKKNCKDRGFRSLFIDTARSESKERQGSDRCANDQCVEGWVDRKEKHKFIR